MATANLSPTPAKPLSGADSLGILWGGAMLILFAIWFGRDQPAASHVVVYALWALGVGGILLGLYTVLSLRKASDHASLAGQRRMLGAVLAVAGVILAAIAGYLLWTLRKTGLGESVGLALFSLVPLITGLVYRKPATSGDLMRRVLSQIVLVQNVLLLLGAAGMLVFLWLGFVKKVEASWFPELGALLSESLLCLTVGFWLISTPAAERTELSIRCASLISGSFTGLVLLALAGNLTYIWRQDVLLGGVSAWQGDNGYKFWICAYLGLVGLVLMFGSLLLARSEVRNHALLRQSLYGYNAFATGLLLLVFLGTLNVVCYAMFPMTFEWTQTRTLTTLSPQSKRLLSSITEPTTVFVLLPQRHVLFSDVRSLLSNCQAQTDKLEVKYISPDKDFKGFEELARRFPQMVSIKGGQLDENRGLLVVYGALPADSTKKVPNDFIPERKLVDETPGMRPNEKSTRNFTGEAELMNSLKHLVYKKDDRKIYILQGDDELDITNAQRSRRFDLSRPMSMSGGAALIGRMEKDGYKVSGLSFRRNIGDTSGKIFYVNEAGTEKRPDVPDDGWAVIIPGPSKELPKEALDALERFMDRGGKLLATFDLVVDRADPPVLKKSGLEKWLPKYGVNVEDSFVLGLIESTDEDSTIVMCRVPPDTENDLAKQFANMAIPFRTVRVIRPNPKAGKYKAETLLEAYPQQGIIEETSVRALESPIPFWKDLFKNPGWPKRLSRESLPIAVTVMDGAKPTMVVFGDTDFISNDGLVPNRDGEARYSLFISALEWMAERKGLEGLQAKSTKSFSLPASVEQGRMVLLPAWFMFLGSVGLGIGIWLVRRR